MATYPSILAGATVGALLLATGAAAAPLTWALGTAVTTFLGGKAREYYAKKAFAKNSSITPREELLDGTDVTAIPKKPLIRQKNDGDFSIDAARYPDLARAFEQGQKIETSWTDYAKSCADPQSYMVGTQITPSIIKKLKIEKFNNSNVNHVSISNFCFQAHKNNMSNEEAEKKINSIVMDIYK